MRVSDSFFVDAKKILSPNFSEREKNIDLIVLHSISLPEGEYDNDNVEDLFTNKLNFDLHSSCLLYTSPSPRDATLSRMPSSA